MKASFRIFAMQLTIFFAEELALDSLESLKAPDDL